MKCTNCGTELKDEAKFCKACGCQVKQAEKQAEVKTDAPTNRIFEELREKFEQAECTYFRIEEENRNLKKLLLENYDVIKTQRQKNQESQETISKLLTKLSGAEKEVEELKKCLEGKRAETKVMDRRAHVLTCPNCHASIEENTIFCGECGTKIQ